MDLKEDVRFFAEYDEWPNPDKFFDELSRLDRLAEKMNLDEDDVEILIGLIEEGIRGYSPASIGSNITYDDILFYERMCNVTIKLGMGSVNLLMGKG